MSSTKSKQTFSTLQEKIMGDVAQAPYMFFLSHASDDYDPYLKRFFDELCTEIRRRGPLSGEKVGFIAQEDIKHGDGWEEALMRAMASSRVMVSLISPGYLISENCGREFCFFRMRQRQAGAALIKPIIWITSREIPEAVRELDHRPKNGGDEVLSWVRGGHSNDRYYDLVRRLAEEILETAEASDIHSGHTIPRFNDLHNIFDAFRKKLLHEKDSKGGPRHVDVMFLAASPGDLSRRGLAIDTDCNGGKAWRPFRPQSDRSIEIIVREALVTLDIDMGLSEVCIDRDDKAPVMTIRKAEAEKKIVILIVDPWTVALEPYRTLLATLDENNFYNCGVLVPITPNNKSQAGTCREMVRSVLGRWYGNRSFFCDQMESEEELAQAFRKMVVFLRNKIIGKGEPGRPVPASNGSGER